MADQFKALVDELAQTAREIAQETAGARAEPSPAPPRRRLRLTLGLGADDLDEAARALEAIALDLVTDGRETREVTSGGGGSGHYLRLEWDPDMTGDRYRAELEAWRRARREREASGAPGRGGAPPPVDLDAVEARAAEAWETYGSEWQDAVTKMDALSASVADVAPLAAEVRQLRKVDREHTEECGRFVECGGDGRTCDHVVTLVDSETTSACVWCRVERAEAGQARLREALVDIADHGLGADLTPTMPSGPGLYRAFVNYLGRCDSTLRERARRALAGESGGSGDPGREAS